MRFFAANGLDYLRTSLPMNQKVRKIDYLGSPDARLATLNEWRSALDLLDPQARARAQSLATMLRSSRKDVDIEVGE